MREHALITAEELARTGAVIFDCRFQLQDPEAGRRAWREGHIPGAHYLHLDEDLSAPRARHGGRHPLPAAAHFAERMAAFGVGLDTPVVAYDDSGFAMAGRLWWMLRALGYRPPRLLDGGFAAWVTAGLPLESSAPAATPCAVPVVSGYAGCCDIDRVRAAQAAGATLIDSRDPARYRGEVEPIDPVAGHIPGALNKPFSELTDGRQQLLDDPALRAHWGELLAAEQLVVYCGSGVSACANLFALDCLGRGDALLYAGSWSDWCSHMPQAEESGD